jgi:holo-[acyl-carrier protein] synthase
MSQPGESALPVLATGIDLVEVDRIAAALVRFGDRFLQRVFTLDEQRITGTDPLRLAGRFAMKEACSKALGTGIAGFGWRDIECLRDEQGRPIAMLHGNAAALARRLRWYTIAVSISTTRRYCVAMVAALAAPPDSTGQ